MDPMQSLASISVIDGKPTLSAEAMRALIFSAGHELWIEESTTARAVVAGRRRDSKLTQRVTWTMDDAKRARIAGRPNWQAYPRQMLAARASAELARQLFPDIIAGFASPAEIGDSDDFDASPTVLADSPDQPADDKPAASRRRRRPTPVPTPTPTTPPLPGPGEDEPPDAPADEPNQAQKNMMFALTAEKLPSADRDQRLAYCAHIISREIVSSAEMSGLEVSRVIDALNAEPAAKQPKAGKAKPAFADLPDAEQKIVTELQTTLDAVPEAEKPALPGEFPEGY
jgi:hypothetical protein